MRRLIFFVLVEIFFLSGCVNLGPRVDVPSTTYTLDAQIPSPKKWGATSKILLVNPGQAAPGFKTDKIAYQQQDYVLKYYALHRWLAPPVSLIGSALAQNLSNTGAFKAVFDNPLYTGEVDAVISLALIRLQQDFSGDKSQVHLTLQCVIANPVTHKLLASRVFDQVVSAAPNPDGAAQAANLALAKLMPSLVDFVVQTVH